MMDEIYSYAVGIFGLGFMIGLFIRILSKS